MIYQNTLEARIYELTAPRLLAMGYEIIRIRILTLEEGKTLQFMIGRTDNTKVKIEDCVTASNFVSVLLDVEDVISDDYHLEFSSAGVDAVLTRPKDFENNVGNVVKLSVRIPINGQKRFTGRISSFEDNFISLDLASEQNVVKIDFNDVSEAHIDYFASKAKNPKGKKSHQIKNIRSKSNV